MEIVQLGLFSKVFNWVYDKILDPMWEWVSDLLSTGFKYLADLIPQTVSGVMDTIVGQVVDMILEWYYAKWFLVQSAILLLLDCIEDCFNVVSGLSPVYIGKGQAGGTGVPMLFAVFRQETVQRAFFTMIVVGFSICFLMAVIATARTFFELAGENTKPVTHIMRMTARSLLYLLLAPLISFAMILLSQAILTSIDKALTYGDEGKTSIARIVYCIASMDAVDTDKHSDGKEYNISYDDGPSKASLTDKYRKPFYYADNSRSIPNFTDPEETKKTFTFRGFDYFIGIGCGIYFTIVMCMVLVVFIGRVFDVVVLLVIQPFFVGLMPFDDGEYYRRWFELFLGKLFQGYGSVIGMRVYLMLLEQIFSGNIRFSNSNSVGARLQDYLMMLLFAMGGAVAVRHLGPLVTGILSQSAATGEQMTGAAGWAAGAKIAGVEAAGVKKLAAYDAKLVGKPVGKAAAATARGAKAAGGAFMGAMRRGWASVRGGEGSGDGVGKFASTSRPQGYGNVPGAGMSSGIKSRAQAALSSYRPLSTTGAAGAGAFSTQGTGKDKKKESGISMQDILGSGAGQEIELQDLSDKSQEGRFTDSRGPMQSASGSSRGAGIKMQDVVSGGLGQEIEMQDLSGRSQGSRPSVSSGIPTQGSSGNGLSSGSGQGIKMQDVVSGGLGQEIEMQDLSGRSQGSRPSVSSGIPTQKLSGNGLGSSFGQEIKMQDIVSGSLGQEIEMQDLSGSGEFNGGDNDDPLNTAFYDPNTGDDDN